MDIQVGPHLYRNTNGTVEIEGVPQIEFALRKPGGPLSLTFVLFDSRGLMPLKIVNSALAINEQRAYELIKETTSLVLTHRESGEQVLHIELKEEDRVVITQGSFITLKAHHMTITPREWSVDKASAKAGETDMEGKSVSLG